MGEDREQGGGDVEVLEGFRQGGGVVEDGGEMRHDGAFSIP